MYLDHQVRDARAGLSLFAGRSLPHGLFDVASSLGLRVGGWAYPSVIADPGEAEEWNSERLCRLGRTVQEAAYASQISLLLPGDAGWPSGTACDDLPCLWVRGDTDVAGLLGAAVAVTGTNTPSRGGKAIAAGLAADLADAGWTLVTSTDDGIDQHVTATVLQQPNAVPLLVTGGGLDPASSPVIAAALPPVIARSTVISMAPPGARPWRARVRARSELLYRLGAAAVLVEADARSRHLGAVRSATRSGRLVCAVPGPAAAATFEGCRMLVREAAAHPVADAQQVLDAIDSRTGIQPFRRHGQVRARPQPGELPTLADQGLSDPGGGGGAVEVNAAA